MYVTKYFVGLQGIWAGMIFGGTAVQTLILCFITLRCDWEKEVKLKYCMCLSLIHYENSKLDYNIFKTKICRRKRQMLVLTNGPTL